MTYKVGPKGQVVLPKAMREQLGIHPGDEVVFEEAGGAISVRRVEPVRLRGLARDASDPLPLTRSLELERAWERAHDEMRDAETELGAHAGRAR
jgi:AbrB family looped-hinge helix DNA binding protein